MHPSGSDNCGETKRSDFEGVVYLFQLVFLVPHLPFISNHHPEVLRHHLQSSPAVRNSSRPSSVTPRPIHTQGHSSILGATSSTTYLGIYQPFITPTTHPRNL